MHEFIVIGGGISGLSTAWFLHRAGRDVQVIDGGSHPGGSIQTAWEQGFQMELGPNTIMDNKPSLRRLIAELGLEAQVQEANRAAKKRFIVRDGRPLPIPMSPVGLVRSPLWSGRGKRRLFREPFVKAGPGGEESVADFMGRRLGWEIVDWALDPFVSGVYAGDPRQLSIQAAFPKLYELERDYGSLMTGAIRAARAKKKARPKDAPKPPKSRLISFEGGLATLPGTIAEQLGTRYQGQQRVDQVIPEADHWLIRTGDQHQSAEQIVFATPAQETAELLADWLPAAADALRAIDYPPVHSVSLGFRRSDVGHPLDGFGALIPSREGQATLGALFLSTLFPGRAPDDTVLLTCFIGGARGRAWQSEPAEAVVQRVVRELSPLLDLRADPVYQRVTPWPRAIPQYNLGHLERLAAIDAAAATRPGLHFRANWRDGIAVGDCVENGLRFAERLAGTSAEAS